MSISFQTEARIFHLRTKSASYAMQILSSGHLVHLYWGKRLASDLPDGMVSARATAFGAFLPDSDWQSLMDIGKFEYPCYGNGDFRTPALQIQFADGSTVGDLRYVSHTVAAGKPKLAGLPAVYTEQAAEADTLTILLRDALQQLDVELSYSVLPDYDVLTRSVRIINHGRPCDILKAASAAVDFADSRYDLLTLPGAWARERRLERQPLRSGVQSVASARGASSHQQHPWIALAEPGADENRGDIYAFSLVYSGNFAAETEVDSQSQTRVMIGINPFDFRWRLDTDAVFQTPETVMVYSAEGLGGMSRRFHKLYRERLCRGKFRDADRYILINNWEATYFNFNAEQLVGLAAEAKGMGIELFVLDDGWFGKRDSDNCSLGDWVPDRRKLPEGITGLAQKVTALGLKFGLWFEPEMVSPDSDLYRAHPDWCLHVNGRARSEGRNQLILDYSRPEVRQYIIDAMSKILDAAPVSYIKWDMNRHMTEIGSEDRAPEHQRETAHRYILGLYEVLETLTSRYPDLLFECCSGGGGRFDPGMLYYMPQTWASDDSDAVCRMQIQYGTSIVYPPSAIGAHVSAVPNHQVGRITPLETRGLMAMSGNFGYELDLRKLSDDEKEAVKHQIAFYKRVRRVVLYGNQYRLKSPFEGNETAWIYVRDDRREAVAFYFYTLAQPNVLPQRLKFAGLDPALRYRVEATGEAYAGDFLMQIGLWTPELWQGDFRSYCWHLLAE